MGGGKRRPSRNSGGRRFCVGEVPAKIKTESSGPHSRCNAVPYSYNHLPPDDPSRPIRFASSSVVAFVDPTPSTDVDAPVPSYNYDPAITGGLGLGFQNDEAESEDEEEEEEESEGKGEGFLSIGGVRVYTEDTSSPEDDVSGSGSGSDSSDDEAEEGQSSDGSSSEDDDGSEIDEEMVDDYVEGIGGSSELLSSKWMAKRNLEEEFMDFESSSDGEDGGKLGAIDLMNVSKEYGMPKKEKKKINKVKVNSRRERVEFRLSAAMDDLMFEKDGRMVSGRKGKKKMKDISQLSRSWPREGQRSRDYYGAPGIY